jgi:hypothetical protein
MTVKVRKGMAGERSLNEDGAELEQTGYRLLSETSAELLKGLLPRIHFFTVTGSSVWLLRISTMIECS